MKKVLSLVLAVCFILGAVPCLAASPYEIVSEFSNGELTGVTVKKSEGFKGNFTLYASYTDGEYVYDVKSLKSSQIENESEISFDMVEGAEIELFAWDDDMIPVEDLLSDMDYSTVMEQLKKVNDYWINENSTIYTNTNPWDVAVFHTGNMQAYYMTGDELYRNYSEKWSEAHSWQSFEYPINDPTNADNMCCFRTYIDLFNIDSENADISYVTNQVNTIVNSARKNYWNWIDTFYMAGPIFTKMYELTGEEKYLDKMYEMIKYTAENLNCYDEEEGLWFRDAGFINYVGENGGKVFWSRGDGWVYAAFAQIIEELPDSYEHKDYFVDIFLEMSAALKKTQCEEGAWHESLMDPDYNPDCEESGTGFFTYGMLWGINNGYLDENEYLGTALKGWKWLTEVALQPDGRVGYVQHIGAQPSKIELSATSTEDYAYANFVFAASEMAKYLGGVQGDVVPYLQKKLLGNIEIYKMDSPYYIKNGEICEFTHPMIIEEDGDIKILVGDMYTLIEEYIPEGMYLYEKDGVYIVSEFITPFNKSEENLIEVLSDILTEGKFPERPYTDPDRIAIKVQESVAGGGNEGEVEEPTGPRGEGAAEPVIVGRPLVIEATEVELIGENITASYIAEPHNGPANAVDGNLDTRMALQVMDEENPEYIEVDLGGEYEICTVGMSFYMGNQRKNFFSISVSEDGVNYTEVIPLSYTSGSGDTPEYYKIDPTKASYVRIYGYGNSSASTYTWFSLTELEIFHTEIEINNLPVNAVEPKLENLTKAEFNATASIITESENGPDNINDGDFSSYCVIRMADIKAPEYMQFDLGEIKDVEYVALAFRNGAERKNAFRIDVSEDGSNFKTVVPKSATTGETSDYEYYLIDAQAQYIRVYGYYSTANINWVSITEAEVYVN